MKNTKLNFRNNSITFIRYFAAFQVLYLHIVNHFELTLPTRLINLFSGVPIFFCISGFLIANSLNKDTVERKTYFKSRFLRIYPELWLAIVINAFVMIWLNSTLIKSLSFWLFNITQGTFMQFWTPSILRNYGVGVPNGSLWTITIFVQFYILIYFLFPKIRKCSIKMHVLLLSLSYLPNLMIVWIKDFIPEIIYKLFMQTIIPYWFLFYIGILLYLYREFVIPKLVNSFYLILSLFLVYGLCFNNIKSGYMDPIRISLLAILGIAFSYKFSNIKIKKDYSFGIYIYHMIFVNILIETKIITGYSTMIVVSTITILAAVFTTNLFNKIGQKRIH